MTILSENDFIIFPMYIGLSTLFILFYSYYRVKPKYRTSFILSFFLKVICTISFTLIFEYYYQVGDTFDYYADALLLKSSIEYNIENIKYLFLPASHFWSTCHRCEISYADSNFFVVKIATILLFPTLGSYPATALLMGMLSSLGSYQIIKIFAKNFPTANFTIAFFIPSVLFWSSGIMKDGLCIFALGYLFSTLEKIFEKKKVSLLQLLWLAILGYSILIIKGYILICFAFSYIGRITAQIRKSIKNSALAIAAIFCMSLLLVFGVILMSKISEKFVFENLLEAGLFTQKYILELQGGSSYEIKYDTTPLGILSAIAQSFVVSFFRPYIWEAGNPFMFLFSVETILTYGFAIGYITQRKKNKTHSLIMFSLIFSITFGIVVGFTSSNFGALMRYKIPSLLFYILAIIALGSRNSRKHIT